MWNQIYNKLLQGIHTKTHRKMEYVYIVHGKKITPSFRYWTGQGVKNPTKLVCMGAVAVQVLLKHTF